VGLVDPAVLEAATAVGCLEAAHGGVDGGGDRVGLVGHGSNSCVGAGVFEATVTVGVHGELHDE
jgi:hypothetical protein